MKSCYFCKGSVASKRIDHMARRDDQYILVLHVQAEVCEQCGEVYLDAAASRQIDKAIANVAGAAQHLEVPVVVCG